MTTTGLGDDHNLWQSSLDSSNFTHYQDVAQPRYTRDPTFYFIDNKADFVVRVEDTLFKVERACLAWSPIILHRYLFPHEAVNGNFASDEKPLHVNDSTPEEFRSLLWILYTPPHVVQRTMEEQFNIDRLFHVAVAAKKYEYSTYLEWALNYLDMVANNDASMSSHSSATLSRFVDVAVTCGHEDLVVLLVKKWCNRLFEKSTPTVPAIQTADKHNLYDLRGVAYFLHIQDMIDRQSLTNMGVTQLRPDPKLNGEQVMRVMSGYWSLVTFWEHFRRRPIEIPRIAGCEGHSTCTNTWMRRWHSAVGWKRILGINSADILGLMGCLHDELKGDEELSTGTYPLCRSAGLNSLKEIMDFSRTRLADHFTGIQGT